jgi:hypothetical protein
MDSIFDNIGGNAPAPAQPNGQKASIFDDMPEGTTRKATVKVDNTVGTPDSPLKMAGLATLQGLKTSIFDPLMRTEGQVADYLLHPEDRQTKEGGIVTPQQKAAAKLLGASVGNKWGPILSASQEQLDKHQGVIDSFLGLNQKQQQKRDAAIAAGKTWQGPIEGLLQHSALRDLFTSEYNPNKSNTLLYDRVNQVVKLQNIIANRSKYSPATVKAAQKIISQLQQDSKKSLWEKTKSGLKQMVENPEATASGLQADPELFAAPEFSFGEGAVGEKLGAAVEGATQASRYAKMAETIAAAAKESPDVAQAASEQAAAHGEQAAKLTKEASALAKKRALLRVGSSALSGAGINAGISAEQQKATQGYVQKGSLGPAAATGALLGGGLSALGKWTPRKEFEEHIKNSGNRTAENNNPTQDTQGNPTTQNEGNPPGEPLSPQTPVNDKGKVSYTGGVDVKNRVIHVASNLPDSMPFTDRAGNKVNIPVKKTIAYHESVEKPLMDLSEPMSPEAIARMQERITGQGKLTPAVLAKMQKGEPLTYPEAHEIATWAENNMVEELYNVDSKVYQKALKPHIKTAGVEAEKAPASETPSQIDTKPYDDMGHPENVKGQGARLAESVNEDSPASKGVQLVSKYGPGAATAGAVGAAAGSYLSDKGKKEKGALGGALAMFLGRLANTHDMNLETIAEGMKNVGKSADEIHAKTGMVQTADGKWAHEISDDLARIPIANQADLDHTEVTGKAIPLMDVLQHHELEDAYGHVLEKIKIRQKDMPDNEGGYYDPATKTITINRPDNLKKYGLARHTQLPVLLHEIQHGVQHAEGWPTGDSPEAHEAEILRVKAQLEDQIPAYQKVIDALRKQGKTQKAKLYQDKLNEIKDKIDRTYNPWAVQKEAYRRYQASAGEQQANLTQQRSKLLPEQRTAPGKQMTIPLEQQRVSYNRSSFSKQVPSEQEGNVTFDQAKRLALLAGGGLAGYAMASDQHKLAGAIKGSLAGLIFGNVTWRGTQNLIKAVRAADTDPRASAVLNKLESNSQIDKRHFYATTNAIRTAIPDETRQTAISHWLEGDRSVTLSQEEKKAALSARLEFDNLLRQAQQVGIIDKGLDNYVTHVYSKDPVTQALLEQYRASNVKQTSKYGLQRKGPPTLKAALAAGMKVTTNIPDILDHYGEDLISAIHGKIAIDALKKMQDGAGNPLVVSATRAPGNYVTNDHPALRGLKIHPAIAAEMSHIFDVYRPGIVAGSYDALNNAVRRVKLSFSLFHAKNLADVAMGMKGNPLANIADVGKSAVGKSAAHQMIAHPVPGDAIDQMIKGGAVGEFSNKPSGNMDEGRPMEATLNAIGDSLDKTIPGGKHLVEPIKWLDKATQKLLWKNVWTGLKATAIETKFNTLKQNWANEVARNPQAKMPSDDELWSTASSFGNNTFGGLNWRRIANEVKNKYLRQLTMSAFAPAGRRKMGVMMLAPDFTAATMRHIIKMYGEGTGVKGLFTPRTLADLHRQWFIKSALYYMIVGNAINVALSGHYMWDNKDPLMIDMGDGRKMQWSKVLTDPFRIAAHPGQEAVNKLNPLIQEAADQALNVQYLSSSGHAPRMEGMPAHLAHAAQLFDPIQSSQIGQSGWSSLIYGTAGTPVYGETDKMREQRKEEGIKKRQEERRNHPRRTGWKTHY